VAAIDEIVVDAGGAEICLLLDWVAKIVRGYGVIVEFEDCEKDKATQQLMMDKAAED
jgi:hypothetical protein